MKLTQKQLAAIVLKNRPLVNQRKNELLNEIRLYQKKASESKTLDNYYLNRRKMLDARKRLESLAKLEAIT